MINIKKVKPMFTAIVTTMDRNEQDETVNGIIVSSKAQKGAIKEMQKVIAVGDMVRNVKVGDMIMFDPKAYSVMKHQNGSLKNGVIKDNPVIGYNFNTITLDNKDYLVLQDRDITFVVEDYEEVKDTPPSPLIVPDKSVIV